MDTKTRSQQATERFVEGVRWYFAGSLLAVTLLAAWLIGTAVAAIGNWLLS